MSVALVVLLLETYLFSRLTDKKRKKENKKKQCNARFNSQYQDNQKDTVKFHTDIKVSTLILQQLWQSTFPNNNLGVSHAFT